MRRKEKGINIGVDEKEKEKITKKAKKCHLSLSAYLRKCALNQEIIEVPNDNFRVIYTDIVDLRFNIERLNNEQIIEELKQIESKFRKIYSGGNANGNNENMGD